MRNLNTYEQWQILEKNKTVQYFQEHPELLQQQFYSTPSHKNEWNPDQTGNESSRQITAVKKKSYDKLIKLANGKDFFYKSPNDRGSEVFPIGWMVGWSGTGMYSFSNSSEYNEAILKSRTPEDFKTICDKNHININYYTKPYEIEDYWKFLSDNWKEVQRIIKDYVNAIDGLRNREQKHYNNELLKLGVNASDLKKAMSWVQEWTSMSRKRMPEDVWPLLKTISVDSGKLPKVLYRGIFYDGAKIKDQQKFLEKWKPGSQPGAGQGKATSWSIDRGTASSFMQAQDFIKDQQNGFHVLLKWEVDEKEVICDLRNLPVDHKYWNQQEFIVSPAARNYTVDTLIPGSDDQGYRDFCASIKGGAGAWGQMKKEYIANIMNVPFDTFDANQKIEWKQIMYMTLGQARAAYGITNWSGHKFMDDVSYPLCQVLSNKYVSGFAFAPIAAISETEIELGFFSSLSHIEYSRDPVIKATVEAIKNETKYNQFGATDEIFGKGKATILSKSFYDVEVIIELPTSLTIQDNGKKENKERDIAVVADDALKKIFNTIGERAILDSMEIGIKEIKTSRNIQITIK
jgi:hypothetical protein